MGKAFDSITDQMRSFIEAQHMFFVATAPSEGGHVNLSPKGLDSFRVLDENQVAYRDLTGSGAETIAHVRDNGRITFMFCAFDGKPNITRLYGTATVVLPTEDRFNELESMFDERRGVRSFIVATIDRTSNSCGFSVPFMDHVGPRTVLDEWVDRRTDDDIEAYWAEKNARSIDGLPALG